MASSSAPPALKSSMKRSTTTTSDDNNNNNNTNFQSSFSTFQNNSNTNLSISNLYSSFQNNNNNNNNHNNNNSNTNLYNFQNSNSSLLNGSGQIISSQEAAAAFLSRSRAAAAAPPSPAPSNNTTTTQQQQQQQQTQEQTPSLQRQTSPHHRLSSHHNNNHHNNHHNSHRHPLPPWYRRGCMNRGFRSRQVRRFLNSRGWNVVLIVLTLILLFGGPFRELCLSSQTADDVCNIVFCITMAIFVIDIILRVDNEPDYFNIYCCGRGFQIAKHRLVNHPHPHHHNQYPHHHHQHQHQHQRGSSSMSQQQYNEFLMQRQREEEVALYNKASTQIGSFFFWCDVISALTLLHEISWINTKYFDTKQIEITVDTFGVPTQDSFLLNQGTPLDLEAIDLFVAIGKTARLARFIRSSRAVKVSAKVNWYFLLNLCNPFWWLSFIIPARLLQQRHNFTTSSSTTAATAAGGRRSGIMARNSLRSSGKTTSTRSVNSLGAGGHAGSVGAAGVGGGAGIMGGAGAGGGAGSGTGGSHRSILSSTMQHDADDPPVWQLLLWRVFARRKYDNWRQNKAAGTIQRAWRRYVEAKKILADAYHNMMYSCEDALDHYDRSASAFFGTDDRLSQVSSAMRPSGGSNGPGLRRSKSIFNRSFQDYKRKMIPRTQLTNMYLDIKDKRRSESQVGKAMRELTGRRVAIGIIVALILTVLFNYKEDDATRPATMITLHSQTSFPAFADESLRRARMTSIPDLYLYQFANGTTYYNNDVVEGKKRPDELRPREKLQIRISVQNASSPPTIGEFSYRKEQQEKALLALLSTLFNILVWFFGVTAFAGPVMVLIVIPIERMVRLLAMLMLDPLGYQGTSKYRRFVAEEDKITKNTRWTKEVLKGMETSFLMSTILRIGSLMKVGFGSAGVEIIRESLEKGQSKNNINLKNKGATVSCIFLFCDIRNFTDATESLQEEVFVFTNRIAAVVHSYCAYYAGSANKNVGDAFLLSWKIDEDLDGESLVARNNQADKALLAVVRICMALRYDEYYLGTMSEVAREALISKLKHRKGPIVQMGFGMHAGKAVQGAIGSQMKIDPTYVSEHVERAEFLESSTKKYGLLMLMSDSFHGLLEQRNRRRCRKIDQIMLKESDDEEDEITGEIMDILTFDMDIDAWWDQGIANALKKDNKDSDIDLKTKPKSRKMSMLVGSVPSDEGMANPRPKPRKMSMLVGSGSMEEGVAFQRPKNRKMSMLLGGTAKEQKFENQSDSEFLMEPHKNSRKNQKMKMLLEKNQEAVGKQQVTGKGGAGKGRPERLVLPKGLALYNPNVWFDEDMRVIRQRYADGIFFQKFNKGLHSFYNRDWDTASECFNTILTRYEDGPSRYFLDQIKENKGKPPLDFLPYGIA